MTALPPGWGRRYLLRLSNGWTHVRRAGPEGAPALVCLHGSPESADALRDTALRFARDFDVFAPDTPGNAWSDPLRHDAPDSRDYAEHVLEVMDAFGIARAGLYGFHTGAATAMETALIAPDRVTALTLDGYPVWTEDERADLLAHYLPHFSPREDGSHLQAVWDRLEAQRRFFPWYRTNAAARLDLKPLAFAVRLRRVRDLLMAGDAYAKPYAAAFTRRGEDGPGRVQTPCLIGGMAGDPLARHPERLPDRAPGVETALWDDRDRALGDMSAFLRRHPGSRADKAPPGDPRRGFAGTGLGQIHWMRGGHQGRVRLHGPGGCAALAPGRDGLAIDLPGHGLSADAVMPDSREALLALIETLTGYPAEVPPSSFKGSGPLWQPDDQGAFLQRLWDRAPPGDPRKRHAHVVAAMVANAAADRLTALLT